MTGKRTGWFKADELKRVDIRTLSTKELRNVEKCLKDVARKGSANAQKNLDAVRARIRELELS